MRARTSTVGRIALPILTGAALSFFGFIPLMGLPGAVFLEAAALWPGFPERLAAMGPGAWGSAIFTTWCAGAGVPLGCWLLWAARTRARAWAWVAAGAAGYILTGLAAAALSLLDASLR